MLKDAIKALRIDRGMSQEDLAKLLGCDRVTISHYEAGRVTPPLYVAQKIAQVFNKNVDELLNYAAPAARPRA